MDLSNFFSFFNPKSNFIKHEEILEEFKGSPLYNIMMFKKLVINGMIFKKSLINFFTDSNNDLDMSQVDLAGEFMVYNRAWFWVSQLNWDDEEWVKDLIEASNDDLLIAVKLSINYFEEQEEYEKCAFLKKIQDFVQNYLATKD